RLHGADDCRGRVPGHQSEPIDIGFALRLQSLGRQRSKRVLVDVVGLQAPRVGAEGVWTDRWWLVESTELVERNAGDHSRYGGSVGAGRDLQRTCDGLVLGRLTCRALGAPTLRRIGMLAETPVGEVVVLPARLVEQARLAVDGGVWLCPRLSLCLRLSQHPPRSRWGPKMPGQAPPSSSTPRTSPHWAGA